MPDIHNVHLFKRLILNNRLSPYYPRNELEEERVQCPYCGEFIDVLIDCSEPFQSYIEDCRVCCRPMKFDVSAIEGSELIVLVSGEDD